MQAVALHRAPPCMCAGVQPCWCCSELPAALEGLGVGGPAAAVALVVVGTGALA